MELSAEIKKKIESIFSEILSDMHDCRVTLHFVPVGEKEKIRK